jgi:hypothetical protein
MKRTLLLLLLLASPTWAQPPQLVPPAQKQETGYEYLKAHTVTIPLIEMWSRGMSDEDLFPPTKSPALMQSTAAIDPPAESSPLSSGILGELSQPTKPYMDRIGFVVTGTPREALVKVHDVVANKQPRQSEFTTDDRLTLAFMSYNGFHMTLEPVEVRKGGINEVVVHYFVLMTGRNDYVNWFVLIPLGQLPAGTWHVAIDQVPGISDANRNGPEPIIPRVSVSSGFVFTVK